MGAKFSPANSDDDLPSMSEINITPFVDVVLVLLVIFMVTAPMLVREQMSVNLPKAESGEKSASDAIAIVIDKEGNLQIGGKPTDFDGLAISVADLAKKSLNAQAVISADQLTKHGDVVRVLDLIKKLGITRFAIQIERK